MVDGCQGSARTCPMCGYDNALIKEGYKRKRRETGETSCKLNPQEHKLTILAQTSA